MFSNEFCNCKYSLLNIISFCTERLCQESNLVPIIEGRDHWDVKNYMKYGPMLFLHKVDFSLSITKKATLPPSLPSSTASWLAVCG